MRINRVEKFKRIRKVKTRNIFIFGFFLPTSLIFAGYLISSLFILPVINK